MANSLPLTRYSLSAPLWSLALAIHLLAVFKKGPEPVSLRKWGWVYCLFCYGGPFAVGLAHLDLAQAKTAMAGGNAEVRFPYDVHLHIRTLLISSRSCLRTPPTRCFKSTSRYGDAFSLHSSFTPGLALISLGNDMNPNKPGRMKSQAPDQATRVPDHLFRPSQG
jgi:hypothetical protein